MKRCYKSRQQFHPGDGVCLGFNCPGFHGEKHDRRGPSAQIDETVVRFHDVKEKQDVIVRELKDVIGSWRHASGDGWESRRIVLASAGTEELDVQLLPRLFHGALALFGPLEIID